MKRLIWEIKKILISNFLQDNFNLTLSIFDALHAHFIKKRERTYILLYFIPLRKK